MLKYTTDKSETSKAMNLADESFKDISKLKGKDNVVIAEDQKTEVYFVSNQLIKIYEIISKKKHPYSIGFYFGKILKQGFEPGLETLYKYAKESDFHKVVISRKEEMRFLYGRDIRAGQIRTYDGDIKKGDTVIICNKSNEALGTGKLVGDINDSKPAEPVIKNTMDRGWYLRHKE